MVFASSNEKNVEISFSIAINLKTQKKIFEMSLYFVVDAATTIMLFRQNNKTVYPNKEMSGL